MLTRKLILGYITLTMVVLSSSFACNDSEYSLGDFRISIATVVPEEPQSYSLTLDNGKKLWPEAADVYYKPSVNQRVFVNYTILTDEIIGFDHYIKVNDIWNVLTKPIIELTEEIKDSIGNDPIKVNDFWIGDNYLNTSFSFNYNGIRPHAINMVINTIEGNEDEETLELEFRHNSYNSKNNSLYNGFAAFDLRPFRQVDKDSIPITIKVKDWKEVKTFKLMYKYNEINKSRQMKAIPDISSNEYN